MRSVWRCPKTYLVLLGFVQIFDLVRRQPERVLQQLLRVWLRFGTQEKFHSPPLDERDAAKHFAVVALPHSSAIQVAPPFCTFVLQVFFDAVCCLEFRF